MHLVSGRAVAAAIYPKRLCQAILDGIEVWLKSRSQIDIILNGLVQHNDELCEEHEAKPEREGVYWDDVKGGELDKDLVKRARKEELDVFA